MRDRRSRSSAVVLLLLLVAVLLLVVLLLVAVLLLFLLLVLLLRGGVVAARGDRHGQGGTGETTGDLADAGAGDRRLRHNPTLGMNGAGVTSAWESRGMPVVDLALPFRAPLDLGGLFAFLRARAV